MRHMPPLRMASTAMKSVSGGQPLYHLRRVSRKEDVPMTEAEWLVANHPFPMLAFLQRKAICDRKLRLYACACCRRLEDVLLPLDPRTMEAITLAEDYCDGNSCHPRL